MYQNIFAGYAHYENYTTNKLHPADFHTFETWLLQVAQMRSHVFSSEQCEHHKSHEISELSTLIWNAFVCFQILYNALSYIHT